MTRINCRTPFVWAIVSCVQLAAADFSGAAGSVESQASGLKSLVDQWSSADGLQGALSIQNQFPVLSNAVNSLSQAAASAPESAIDATSVSSLAQSISGLLDSLSRKASDFKNVGASDIVGNDITALKAPAVDVVNIIVKLVGDDCRKASSLAPALQEFSDGFESADSAYGLPPAGFPDSVSCNGGGNAGNSVSGIPSSEASVAASTAAAMIPVASESPALPLLPQQPSGITNNTVPVLSNGGRNEMSLHTKALLLVGVLPLSFMFLL